MRKSIIASFLVVFSTASIAAPNDGTPDINVRPDQLDSFCNEVVGRTMQLITSGIELDIPYHQYQRHTRDQHRRGEFSYQTYVIASAGYTYAYMVKDMNNNERAVAMSQAYCKSDYGY